VEIDRELRERLLRAIWAEVRSVTTENIHNHPAAARAIASGAKPADVVLAMIAAKYDMAFGLLYLLTGEGVEPGSNAATSWAIAKVKFEGDDEIIV
jgi:hypothetical protein